MKKIVMFLLASAGLVVTPFYKTNAQVPVAQVIKEGVTKVIKVVDLEIQRLQTKTIWLQNAQKAVENTMSKLHLNEITGWVKKQKDLYSKYYDELWRVKSIITSYHRIKEIAEKQRQLVAEYKQAWTRLRQDKHFTAGEINYMEQVYSGILDATVQNINQLMTVVSSFTTEMSDAKRMEIIDKTAKEVDANYDDLHRFNTQNALLSLSRAKDENDAMVVKWMYGLTLNP